MQSPWSGYRQSARKRKLRWELKEGIFHELIAQPCYYCGISPRKQITKGPYKGVLVHGLDRLDNCVGYVLRNVRPCCPMCNRAKSTLTMGEFEDWLDNVAYHRTRLGFHCSSNILHDHLMELEEFGRTLSGNH